MLGVLAASVYFATVGLSWGDPPEVAANMDCSLQKLALHAKQTMPEAQVAGVHSQIAKIETADKEQIRGRWDANDRVLVHVLLDGQSTLDEVAEKVQAIQGNVVDRAPNYRHGLLAAYVPTDQLENIAKIGGVRALAMEHRPEVRVGKMTSQGVAVLETDKLNARGLKGDGITVGVLSDSFNTAYQNAQSPPATTAAQDVAAGDLPVVKILKLGGVPRDTPTGLMKAGRSVRLFMTKRPTATSLSPPPLIARLASRRISLLCGRKNTAILSTTISGTLTSQFFPTASSRKRSIPWSTVKHCPASPLSKPPQREMMEITAIEISIETLATRKFAKRETTAT